jgi:type I restriction enzyme R subunit
MNTIFPKTNSIYKQHIVLIFDECHRSQFGDMHSKIIKTFKNYHIFGFTGTPIFAVNAGNGGSPLLRTTEQTFGDKLHAYTIVDAITDGNVLPFRIDFINTIKQKESTNDKKVAATDIDKILPPVSRFSSGGGRSVKKQSVIEKLLLFFEKYLGLV